MCQRIAAEMRSTVSNRVQDQGLLPELAPDAVSQVLQHVEQQQRLGACAGVSNVWRAAAYTATTAINYRMPTSDKQPTLSPWLGKHGSSVKTLDIHNDTLPPHVVQNPDTAVAFMLPFRQLSRLHSLSITHVHLQPLAATKAVAAAALSSEQAASAPNSLAALTALTSLQLTSSALDLSSLAACTSVRHLQLKYMADSARQLDSLLNGALQQLVHLTHLDVDVLYDDVLTDAAFEHLSCLEQLQELKITSKDVTTATLAGLPFSVSMLELQVGPGIGVESSEVTAVFSSSSTPRLQQLTGLQHLGVSCALFDPALLVGLVQLRHLQLFRTPDPPGTAALLSQLAKLTQLQHLDLNSILEEEDGAAVAAYSSLTASSQLSHLDLHYCFIPAGASKHIFSAGRQLPQLTWLAVEADLFPSPGDVQRMVSCCPCLQSLVWGQYSDVRLDAAALAALQQLTRLTQLHMFDAFSLDEAAAAQLATLTTLQELYIADAEQLTPAGLLQLTQLTGLTELEVFNDEQQVDMWMASKALKGCPPDVWQQLHSFLLEPGYYCLDCSEQPEMTND